ncbi:MAG: sulfatase-like hydrolase/transferase [Deltaproteobacteria bacterium]|nr:sulfatase-like hydrolase/transferase [Deltaproteobacteria bacterium]
MSLQRIIVPLSLVLAFVATAILACDREPSGRPNVLLVTIDTLRPDRLGAYGYDRIETPNIDRLAAEGALFETALTDTPWTTPSMSSVMTGTYATHHGFKSTNANRLVHHGGDHRILPTRFDLPARPGLRALRRRIHDADLVDAGARIRAHRE